MIDVEQFSEYVLVPALTAVGLYSQGAHVLMLGTALIESNLEYLEQIGQGRALGVYQIEESTYKDLARYLNRYDNAKLKERCLSACYYVSWPAVDALIHNLKWATIMARVKFAMYPEPLPQWDDSQKMAQYYKKYYNTARGKAELTRCVINFDQAIGYVK